MVEKSKYYFVKSENYAKTIHFLSGISYYVFNDSQNKDKRIYSFERSEKLNEVLCIINETTKKYR